LRRKNVDRIDTAPQVGESDLAKSKREVMTVGELQAAAVVLHGQFEGLLFIMFESLLVIIILELRTPAMP